MACKTFRIVATLVVCYGTLSTAAAHQEHYEVSVKRTSDGVPHIEASSWGNLGFGEGYTQAQDELCTLADSFVTWRGERSAAFGGEMLATEHSLLGRPKNLDSDFFFKSILDTPLLKKFESQQPAAIRSLVKGYSAGFNQYLNELRIGRAQETHSRCRNQSYVREITSDDVYRRMLTLNLAGGDLEFLEAIVTASPPRTRPTILKQGGQVSNPIKGEARFGIGSNALAFGSKNTVDGKSILFGNPHWFWTGPDRFYQTHLIIPGTLNVAGASFLGVPLVSIGFNSNIAWTHTVSTARRFGIFQLLLSRDDPTIYQYNGKWERMSVKRIRVRDVEPGRGSRWISRSLYQTRFGPMLNLSSVSPALSWTTRRGFAIRDVNADNFKTFTNYLEWSQAKSLNQFITIQKNLKATPWVNTLAIGKSDPRVWFSDIGAIPNTPDALVEKCTTHLGKLFDAYFPGVPFFNGTLSQCFWGKNVADESLPVTRMPSLLSPDYVGNFNDSYWLTNPHTPLVGYDSVLGSAGEPQSLRTRYGHALASELIAHTKGVSTDELKKRLLTGASMSEMLFRRSAISIVCAAENLSTVVVSERERGPKISVDLKIPCQILRSWDGKTDEASRGANLWDQFWHEASNLPPEQLYSVQFDYREPLSTPAGLLRPNARLSQALARAVIGLKEEGVSIDSSRGTVFHIEKNGKYIPLFGGCDEEGYFSVACVSSENVKSRQQNNVEIYGNSYIQVVSFSEDGPVADTMLATSESDDPTSSNFQNGTTHYAAKEWSRFLFSEKELNHAVGLRQQFITTTVQKN